jgi:DNA-binding GntR family transcriptional regulator
VGDNGLEPGAGNGASRGSVIALHDRLRQAIVRGEIPAGAVQTQTQLAEALGVSRTPLREALRMLELENLIVRQSNGRFRVAGFSLDELEQLAVMRIALEAPAVRLTVPTLTNADHAELEGLLAQSERLAATQEWEAFEVLHLRFHHKLTSGIGPTYTEQLERLWDHATRYRRAHNDIMTAVRRHAISERHHAISSQEHREILDAVEAYDAATAARGVAVQYTRSTLEIAAQLDPAHPMEKVRTALEAETGSRDLPPA